MAELSVQPDQRLASLLGKLQKSEESKEGLRRRLLSVKDVPGVTQARRYQRIPLSIRFSLQTEDSESTGSTEDFSIAGLKIVSSIIVPEGTPLTLHCSFGEACHLTLPARVMFSQALPHTVPAQQRIGIKFSTLEKWEQKTLASAIEDLSSNAATQEKSLLNIFVAKDARALETPRLIGQVAEASPRSELRRHPRYAVTVVARLQSGDQFSSGYTEDIGPMGMRMMSASALNPGTPVTLQFSFGDVCYLNVSGQVLYSLLPGESTAGKYPVGIKFSAIREFEQKILLSAVQELRQKNIPEEKSLVTIVVAPDVLAVEAAELVLPTEPALLTFPSSTFTPVTYKAGRLLRTRRVVITGIGPVAPIGIGREAFWAGLESGKNGVDRISSFDPSGHTSQIAAEIRDFDPSAIMPHKEVKRMGRSAHLAVAAARLAVDDGRLALTTDTKSQVACVLGTGTSGLEYVEEDFYWVRAGGVGKMRPYAGIAAYAGALSSEVSRSLGLTGPSLTISTGCTGAIDAMGYTFEMIRYGHADVALTGGADAAVSPGILGAFCQMGAVATRFNDTPQRACRPFNKDRDGFVIGEGGWIFIFEELNHALRRGATIYGEVSGYAATCDAYHMSKPLPAGTYTAKAINMALADAMALPSEVDYVNAYGNSTPINDSYETMVIKQVFGHHATRLMISSTKSMVGHSIGACGAGGVAATLLAIYRNIVHPTINYDLPDPACDLDYVPNVARAAEVKLAVCNTLAFGSKNAAMVLRKFEA
jgi:3-oxoacyl-[acyl-carrier-protein] synthase II